MQSVRHHIPVGFFLVAENDKFENSFGDAKVHGHFMVHIATFLAHVHVLQVM